MNITETEIDVVYVALINFRNHLQRLNLEAFPNELDSATKAELRVTNILIDKIVRKVLSNEPT